MRGSFFVANAWGRQPMRPLARVRLAQGSPVECDGGVCRVTNPPATTPPPAPSQESVMPPEIQPAPTTSTSTITASPQVQDSGFPVVPVVAGVGAAVLLGILLGG